jgi:hypothetical protein
MDKDQSKEISNITPWKMALIDVVFKDFVLSHFNPLMPRLIQIYLRIQSVPQREHHTSPLQTLIC